MKGNIILIGFMGTGKTVVGRRLASKYNMNFVDTDSEIEKVSNMTIANLLKKHGEIRLRSEEKLAIKRAAKDNNAVIATGGSIDLNEEYLSFLKENGTIVCLKASPEKIKERIERRNNRPLLNKDKSLERIEEFIKEREKYYQEADFVVDTSDLTIDEVVNKIDEYIAKRNA